MRKLYYESGTGIGLALLSRAAFAARGRRYRRTYGQVLYTCF